MKCRTSGELRAYLDRELAPDQLSAVTAHLAACGRCRDALEDLSRAAGVMQQRLQQMYEETALPAGSDERALAAVRARAERRKQSGLALRLADLRWSLGQSLAPHRVAAVAGVAVLLVLAVLVGTPVGRAAADFVSQFQTQKLKVVTVEPTQVAGVGFDLAHFGTVKGLSSDAMTPIFVSSVDEASKKAGFPVRQPNSLPPGVKQPPQVAVTSPVNFSFTMDVARARAYLDSTGHMDFDLPAKFDGATITVHVPAAVLLLYGPLTEPTPLIVGQIPVVTGEVTGRVSLTEMRDLLLRLPGISPELAMQLRAIDDWTNTLPIPLPKNGGKWREVDLPGGSKGIVLTEAQAANTMTGVLWQNDGRIYGVGGAYSADDVIKMATSMQ